MSLERIVRKSMLVNISDAVAMNARVKYALIGIEIPKRFSNRELREIWRAFSDISKEWGFEIIGGDTVAKDKLNISITLISETKKPLFRSGAKEGDIAAFTGDLGSVGRDLKRALRGVKLSYRSKFVTPVLKSDFLYKVAPFINAATDISDSLSKDLSRISLLSGVGFEFFKKFDKATLCSGEEYEILFTFPKRNLKRILNIAKQTRTKVTPFAIAKRGFYKNICKAHHF